MANFPLNGPDLREELPLYPPLIQLLRVTDATVAGPAGITQTAGSSVPGPTLYVSFTQQLRTDGLLPRDREPCLADDVNGRGIAPGYYLGRLAGSHTSLPVYEIMDAGALHDDDAGYIEITETDSLPDADGYYQAKLAVENANGTLSSGTRAVWAREVNNTGVLNFGDFYHAHKTGFRDGRDVYTVDDADLTVTNQSFTQIVERILLLYLIPDRCWSIAATATPREAEVKRLFDVRETGGTVYDDIFRITFDPATNWEVDDGDDDGDVTVRRVLDIYEESTEKTTYTYRITFDETDFDVTVLSAGSAEINTEGFTGTVTVLTNCVAGVLKKRVLTFTRGLLKTVGAETDL